MISLLAITWVLDLQTKYGSLFFISTLQDLFNNLKFDFIYIPKNWDNMKFQSPKCESQLDILGLACVWILRHSFDHNLFHAFIFTHMPKVKIMTSTSFNLDQCMHVVKSREDTRQPHNELDITKNTPILQSNIVHCVFMIRGNIGPSSWKTI